MGSLLAATGRIPTPCGQGFLKQMGMSRDLTQRRQREVLEFESLESSN